MKFIVDARHDNYDEGGSAEFYNIIGHKNLGFKQFRNKKHAISAYEKQKLLSRFKLAPKVVGEVCKLIIQYHNYCQKSNWGFVTEKARIPNENILKKRIGKIQKLVEDIDQKTGLKFWDCHYWNVGYIKRYNKAKLVCIDTGNESFDIDCNAWGFSKPGPKCPHCKVYQCSCSKY